MSFGESSYEIVGVVGVLLVLFGVIQAGAGVYFMVTLPIFEIASNVWTGAITGITGIVLTYFGCSNEAQRRCYVILTMCLATLAANVVNVVIIQVGENASFLSEEELLNMKSDRHRIPFQIAIWLTTAVTSLVIFCSYVVAQVLFCSRIQKSSFKGQTSISEGLSHVLQQRKGNMGNRFFPPSRVARSKVECSQCNENCIHGQGHSSSALHDVDGEGEGDRNIEEGIRLGMLTPGDSISLSTITTVMDNDSNVGAVNHAEGVKYEAATIDRSSFSRINISQPRFSTFKPKGIARKNSLIQNKTINKGNVNETLEVENYKRPSLVMTSNAGENFENIPAFLQNHPQSWTFLIPEASNEKAEAEVPKSVEPSQNEVNNHQFLETSKNTHTVTSEFLKGGINSQKRCSSFFPATHKSEENLIKSPKATPKLKRPKDKPPLPPGKIQDGN